MSFKKRPKDATYHRRAVRHVRGTARHGWGIILETEPEVAGMAIETIERWATQNQIPWMKIRIAEQSQKTGPRPPKDPATGLSQACLKVIYGLSLGLRGRHLAVYCGISKACTRNHLGTARAKLGLPVDATREEIVAECVERGADFSPFRGEEEHKD